MLSLSQEDHKKRASGVGSSEAAIILGLAPRSWGTPHDLWRRKVLREKKEHKDAFWFGHKMEEHIILPRYEHKTGLLVRSVPTSRHETIPYVVDSADGIAETPDGKPVCCIEAKTVNFVKRSEWGTPGSDEIPAYYYLQCQWHMAVHKMPYCDVPVIFAGSYDIDIYKVMWDPAAFKAAHEKVGDFWSKYIATKEEPPLDHGGGVAAYLQEKMPQVNEDYMEATEQQMALAARLAQVRGRIQSLTDEEATLKHRLCETIGGHKGAKFSNGWKVSWGTRGRKSTNWKKVAEEAGVPQSIIDKHTDEKTSRYFLANLKGE